MTKEQEDWLVAEVMDSMKMSETEERSARRYGRKSDFVHGQRRRGNPEKHGCVCRTIPGDPAGV